MQKMTLKTMLVYPVVVSTRYPVVQDKPSNTAKDRLMRNFLLSDRRLVLRDRKKTCHHGGNRKTVQVKPQASKMKLVGSFSCYLFRLGSVLHVFKEVKTNSTML